MKKLTILKAGIVAVVIFALAACAPTQVQVTEQSGKLLPRPDRIFVYDFFVSPDEVTLDRGVGSKVRELVDKTPRTAEEKKVGHAVANALAANLVKEIQDMGLPAERAAGARPSYGNILEIDGQFTSVDEGNRTERVVIGLGVGRTDVKTYTQVYDARGGKRTLVSEFDTDAKSGYKPGMAETMGAGALAGHFAASAAVSAGVAGASETFSANVEADAKRTAKEIAKQLRQYFYYQGWVGP